MARTKTTSEDVELEKVKAGLEKARLICNTILYCVLALAGTGCVWIIARAAVEITDKPAWLVFALAILGAGGAPSYIAWRLRARLKQQVVIERLKGGTGDQVGREESAPPASPAGGGSEL